jgi:hypothetical protein
MSRRKRRRHNQTDSRSRKAHEAARRAGETLLGLGVFLLRDRSSGAASIKVLPGITYEDALARGKGHDAFKWVERSRWVQASGTQDLPVGAEVSSAAVASPPPSEASTVGRGAFAAPPAALFDPESAALCFGPVAFECPAGTVFNPRTGGCEGL